MYILLAYFVNYTDNYIFILERMMAAYWRTTRQHVYF